MWCSEGSEPYGSERTWGSEGSVDGIEFKPKSSSLLQRRRTLPNALLVTPLDVGAKVSCNIWRTQSEPVMTPDGTSNGDWIGAYQKLEQVGQGSSGVVYRACRRSRSRDVAVKLMRVDDDELIASAQREYEILRSLQHPYIIEAFEFMKLPMGVALVMDYFPGTHLRFAVRRASSKRFEESTAQHLFVKLIQAVEYIHRNGIIHRDIKDKNILVSTHLDDIRLIDFNVAARTNDGALTMTGTVDYMPPEVLVGESPSMAGDIWAVGLCLYFMICGKLPSQSDDFRALYTFGWERGVRTALQLTASVSEGTSSECKSVIQSCLQVDPLMRSSARELLEEQWMKTKV